jgi:hypothetical protein
MRITCLLLASFLGMALGACGDPEYRPRDEAMPIEDSVFGDQIRTLEKAAGVEDDMKRAAREREEEMRRRGG